MRICLDSVKRIQDSIFLISFFYFVFYCTQKSHSQVPCPDSLNIQSDSSFAIIPDKFGFNSVFTTGSVNWSSNYQELVGDSTLFYSRINFSNNIVLPVLDAPFRLGQTIYYDNKNEFDLSFERFTFSFDKSAFLEAQRKKLALPVIDGAEADLLKMKEDSLRKFEEVRQKITSASYLNEKMNIRKQIKGTEDSLNKKLLIDTTSYLQNKGRLEEMKSLEKEYATLFERKKEYQQEVYDTHEKIQKKSKHLRSLDQRELLRELKSQKLLSKKEEIISNFRTFEIGKCKLSYPSFFTSNVLLSGIHVAYLSEKNTFLSMALGKESSYFSDVYRTQNIDLPERDIKYLRTGKGDITETYTHLVITDFRSQVNTFSPEQSFEHQKLSNGTLVSIESQQIISNESKVNAEVMYQTDFVSSNYSGKMIDNFAYSFQGTENIKPIKGNLGVFLRQSGKNFYNPYSRAFPPGTIQVGMNMSSQISNKLSAQGEIKTTIFNQNNLSNTDRDLNSISAGLRFKPTGKTQMGIKYIQSKMNIQVAESSPAYNYNSNIFLYDITTKLKIAKQECLSSSNIGCNLNATDVMGFELSSTDLLFNSSLSTNISDYLNPSVLFGVASHSVNNNLQRDTYGYKMEVNNRLKVFKNGDLIIGYGYLLESYGYEQYSGKCGMQCGISKLFRVSGTIVKNYSSNSQTFSPLLINTSIILTY